MVDFRYRRSSPERTLTKDGEIRTITACDICGAEQQNNYGLEVNHARRDSMGQYKLSLCGKCAPLVIPILEDAVDRIQATATELRERAQR